MKPLALIVEDSPQIAEREAELIGQHVHVVANVQTEDAALLALERYRINVAIVDLQLAQGTGFGVIRMLRKRKEDPALIVVMTNHAVPALKVACFEAGADYFLDKSMDFHHLARVAAEFAERHARRPIPNALSTGATQ